MKIHYTTVPNARPDGYGTSSRLLSGALNSVGVICSEDPQEIGLIYNHPEAIVRSKAKKKVVYTMFESTKPPMFWRPYLEEADVVVNPTPWGAETFKARYGIDCQVVPLGYDHRFFEYQHRPFREIFTFLMYDCNIRKGFVEVWEAFRQEFGEDEPVRIIFKTAREQTHFPPLCANMEKIVATYTPDQLVQLLQTADCFVFPSRGEGFGHTPLEAMATGLPVISLNAHGISSYFNEAMIGVEHEEIEAKFDYINEKDLGFMYKAKIPSLRQAMRYAFEHRHEMKLKGFYGADYVRRNYSWKKTATMLKELFNTL